MEILAGVSLPVHNIVIECFDVSSPLVHIFPMSNFSTPITGFSFCDEANINENSYIPKIACTNTRENNFCSRAS